MRYLWLSTAHSFSSIKSSNHFLHLRLLFGKHRSFVFRRLIFVFASSSSSSGEPLPLLSGNVRVCVWRRWWSSHFRRGGVPDLHVLFRRRGLVAVALKFSSSSSASSSSSSSSSVVDYRSAHDCPRERRRRRRRRRRAALSSASISG